MKASCSCASSRFGTGVRRGGDRSPSAIRCTASRTLFTPRAHRASTARATAAATAPIATATIDEVPPVQRRRRASAARLVGMPTLSSHGPRSTTALPYDALDAVEAGAAPACAARRAARVAMRDRPACRCRARRRGCAPARGCSCRSASRPSPSGSGMSLNSVCRRVRLRPRRQHADHRALGVAHRIRRARPSAGLEIRPGHRAR